MSNLNFAAIEGKLGKDAVQRATADGAPVVTFSVAVNRGSGDKQETTWVDCVWFGERATKPKLVKGKNVVVTGRWNTRQWTDKDSGAKRARTELVVDDIAFAGFNRVVMVGNLTKDAELFYTGSGKPYLKFRMGVNTGSGDYERADFVPVTMFGQRTEKLAALLVKGKCVAITGEWRTSEWEDAETGEKKSRTEIVIAPYQGELYFVSRPKKEEADDELVEGDALEEDVLEEEDILEE